MSAWLNRCWRLCGTALSFGLFGAGGVLMAICWFPWLRLWPGTQAQKIARIQRSIHHSYRFFLGFMRVMGVCIVDVKDAQRLQQGNHLIVANHPSLLDVVLLISTLPQADCIVKASAWRNPFLRGVLQAAGYISNDDPIALIETCIARLQEGRTVLIFPEGTRSEPGRLQKLKRGAAAIAVGSQCTLTPVTIACTPTTLTKTHRWYQIPDERFVLQMRVGEPIDIQSVTQGSSNHLIAYRKLTQHLQEHFLQTGSYHGIA